jgi:hypothetical protein
MHRRKLPLSPANTRTEVHVSSTLLISKFDALNTSSSVTHMPLQLPYYSIIVESLTIIAEFVPNVVLYQRRNRAYLSLEVENSLDDRWISNLEQLNQNFPFFLDLLSHIHKPSLVH